MIIVIDNQTYYSASELKRMARTEPQIRARGEPDTTAPNPYGWSAPMKLYAETRVHADTRENDSPPSNAMANAR